MICITSILSNRERQTKIMNKLTKVGCSALCGSLAAISAANAGDLSVTGGADYDLDLKENQ